MEPDLVRRIAEGAQVRLDAGLMASVAAQRSRVLTALSAGEPVYGVNTGAGRFAGTKLTARQQADHQSRLLVGRSVGGPPWLPERDVRALFAVRLRGLLSPETGASAEAARFLVERLNDGFVPAVPRGGFGSAGEIIPLSHAFQTFLGVGTVLAGGAELPAAEALAQRGVRPYRPGPKEGMTFLQGSPMATAHALLRAAEGAHVVDLQLVACAMTIDAMGAPRAGYRPELAGPDEVLADVLREVGELVKGSVVRDLVQAPVSVRVGPQALAHARRTLRELDAAASRMLAAPTDSPAFVGGEFVSTAGFHAAEPGLRMDAATAALAHVGEVSVQRMHRLLDGRFSGLPDQLTPDQGPQAGLTVVHKRAVGELHALRRLATPATLGTLDTSAGQEDVQAFACAAGEELRTAIDLLLTITACELMIAHQAHVLRDKPGAPALRERYRRVGELVPPALEDRPLGPEITALAAALRSRRADLSARPAG
ncbi:aromatic amino acid lyase [Amycolatopsis sp. K13G38]|uniref:Aromatic amino acid lyase n=2 Tax=Amycolatopsis acididurans TaxID=2724524 RepID=A0ABX1J9R4_9PSEU|nr:aromatic amino acid lyase [Amycolatopsis acididurans]